MERRLAHLEIGFCLLAVVIAMTYWKLDSKITVMDSKITVVESKMTTILTKLDELLQHKMLSEESLNT